MKNFSIGIKKELDNDGAYESAGISGIGLNYFGATLDNKVEMWTSLDPAEQFWSGYTYAGNGFNPISSIDKNGNALHFIAPAAAGAALWYFWGSPIYANAPAQGEKNVIHANIIKDWMDICNSSHDKFSWELFIRDFINRCRN